MPTQLQIKIAILQALIDHNQSTFDRHIKGELTFEQYLHAAYPIGAGSMLEDAISKLFQEKQNAR